MARKNDWVTSVRLGSVRLEIRVGSPENRADPSLLPPQASVSRGAPAARARRRRMVREHCPRCIAPGFIAKSDRNRAGRASGHRPKAAASRAKATRRACRLGYMTRTNDSDAHRRRLHARGPPVA